MNELCTAWKFDRLKATVLFFLDLGFEMSCECPWWVGWFQGWFCSVLVTHCDVTFGCSLPQLENKLCRAVEGTRHLPILGDCVLFVLGEPHRVKTAVTLSCQTPFADLPICSIQLWHKGPSHFASRVCILKKPLGKACQNFAWQEPTGLSLQIWHPVVTLFPGFTFIF